MPGEGKRFKLKNLKGQEFELLTVQSVSRRNNGQLYWKCLCKCGNLCEAVANALKRGKKKSCGCLKKQVASAQLFEVRKQKRLALDSLDPKRKAFCVRGHNRIRPLRTTYLAAVAKAQKWNRRLESDTTFVFDVERKVIVWP